MEENSGFMDKLAKLVTDFDLNKLLPELDSVVGRIELVARIAVLIGPLLILILGAIYYFKPPAEANHSFGYRFYWGMGSVDAWKFTQKLAGVAWMGLGLVLTLVMVLVCAGFRGMDTMEIVNAALTCTIWEVVLIALVCIAIDVVVALRYDRNGDVRPDTVIKVPENFLELPKRKKKTGK